MLGVMAWKEAPPLSHAAAYAADGPPPSTLLGLGLELGLGLGL